MHNHHRESVSSSPKFFTRRIFLAVGPISGKYHMLYLFLLVTVINGVVITDRNTGYFTYDTCKQYETSNTHCTPYYIELSKATNSTSTVLYTVYTM